MKLLFVDDTNIFNCNQLKSEYEISIAKNKKDAFQLISKTKFSAIFVNVKFNNDFVEKIKEIDTKARVYLLNNEKNNAGLVEHASLIDGYFVSPSQEKMEKVLNKIAFKENLICY